MSSSSERDGGDGNLQESALEKNAVSVLVASSSSAPDSKPSDSSPSSFHRPNSRSTNSDVADLQAHVRYLSHQMRQVMQALNVARCSCTDCSTNGQLSGLFDQAPSSTEQQVNTLLSLIQQQSGVPLGVPPPRDAVDQRSNGGGKATAKCSTPRHETDLALNAMSTSAPSSSALFGSLSGPLRGRGRGRPRLIGDRLDAELVDYMVKVRRAEPYLTATRALDIAREYIQRVNPSILEENGGSVKLRLTWAMKLVSRATERQRELDCGLPAGTFAAARTRQNQAQTLARIMGGGGGGEEAQREDSVSMPGTIRSEIVNIRQLDMSLFSDGSPEVDGEKKPHEEDEEEEEEEGPPMLGDDADEEMDEEEAEAAAKLDQDDALLTSC